ncbi:TetR/AcrR family transcriptional regulator C-terminal domain-containing protein [Labrys neptuniae]
MPNASGVRLATPQAAGIAASIGPEALATLIPDTGEIRADLETVGARLIRAVTAPDVAALHRLTIAEMTHHPQLQKSWRDDGGTEALTQRVADYLSRCHDHGALAVPEPHLSARQFLHLMSIEAQVASLRGLEPLSDARIEQIARETVDLVLRAHRV